GDSEARGRFYGPGGLPPARGSAAGAPSSAAAAATVRLAHAPDARADRSRRQGCGIRYPRPGAAVSSSVDVNLLLYASDEASPRYAAAREFLDRRAADPELFCLAWPTLMSYLRIATHPSIFAAPLSPAEALANVEALLALPQVRALSEAHGFLETY